VAARLAVTVPMARSARFGGEFSEQALAVALAHACRPSQASTGRRLAGL